MQLEERVRRWLAEIIDCGEAIQRFADGRSFDDFTSNRMLRSAIEREFITIGEALGSGLRAAPALETAITEARDIVDFRNVLVHGYTKVFPNVVWSLVETGVPVLLAEIRALLAE
jgi:uncharacterized protein with HEPN domain